MIGDTVTCTGLSRDAFKNMTLDVMFGTVGI